MSQSNETIVVVGAGHCGGQLVSRLRAEGFDGRVILVGSETHLPYQRPPLSKQFLAGEVDLDRVRLRPAEFYEKSAIELRLGTPVDSIDRGSRTLEMGAGEVLSYDKLVLATGGHVRRLPVPGGGLDGVHYLRTIDDARAIRARCEPGARLAVVGGGYIGLEVAAVAAQAGVAVTVLEMESRLLGRVSGPEVAEFYRRVHEEAGVTVRTGFTVTQFVGDERVEAVMGAEGERVETDCVVVGIGIMPTTALAEDAGLATDNGIVVNEFGETSDPDIFAAGDCTNHPNDLHGRRIRLESVHNAMAQAKVVAANLCGKREPYSEVPWFWSDQFDLKLQIVGLSEGYDASVVRGRPQDRAFTVFYLQSGRLIAADTVNGMKDHLVCRTLVARRVEVPPDRLSDPSIALKDLP